VSGKKNNATSSWSGYNHQGQVGIFLSLSELNKLIENGISYQDYSVQFEKEDGEDIDIVRNSCVISRHQVKAKTSSKNLNDYSDVLLGFKIEGVNKDSRYLHTIREVIGFDLSEEEFKKLPNKPKYIPNDKNVKLYKYPDGYKYCELSNAIESKIDSFCKEKIKNLLKRCSHNLSNDDEHIKETLFELKELLCTKIREAHEIGGGANPVILFSEIYEVVTSTQKREKQSICRIKRLFEIYWNKNIDDNINTDLFNEILNLSPEQFECFIIDLHPQKSIKSLKEEVAKISEENTKKEKEEKLKIEEKKTSENTKNSTADYSNYSSSVILSNGNTPGEIGAYAAKRLEALTGESAKTWEYIIARESNGNPEARNPSGAYGLLQLMPMHGNPRTVDEQIEIGANLYHKAKAYFGNGLQPWGM